MNSILTAAKSINIRHNVSIRVIDEASGKVVSSHTGHNAATNSMLTGIAHYLIGDGVLNQGSYMLDNYIPKYISLGTMGLYSQEEDEHGLPIGIGNSYVPDQSEEERFTQYMSSAPGYGADGYDSSCNNNRTQMGLGAPYSTSIGDAIGCELVSPSFPRAEITFKDIVPETESEYPKTIDVVFSAFISTGALQSFRNGRDHIFITEAGLWSRRNWSNSNEGGIVPDTGYIGEYVGDNGLLAGYRIAPPSDSNWDMAVPNNRQLLKSSIIRVGINQIVQVIWKVQLGGIEQFGGIGQIDNKRLVWEQI